MMVWLHPLHKTDMTYLLQKTYSLASTEMKGCVTGCTKSCLTRLAKVGNIREKTALGFSLKPVFAVPELGIKV